jgi:hypothetical protein
MCYIFLYSLLICRGSWASLREPTVREDLRRSAHRVGRGVPAAFRVHYPPRGGCPSGHLLLPRSRVALFLPSHSIKSSIPHYDSVVLLCDHWVLSGATSWFPGRDARSGLQLLQRHPRRDVHQWRVPSGPYGHPTCPGCKLKHHSPVWVFRFWLSY